MKRYLLFVLLALQDNSGTIEGTVHRADTGEPIVAAIITLDGSLSGMDAVTDKAGHFVIRNVRPGSYTILAGRTGYSSVAGSQRSGTIRRGERVENANLTLTLARVLRGRLLDPEGKPMRGLTVRAMRIPVEGGAAQEAASTQTNERGDYRLWGLNPGRYYVTAKFVLDSSVRVAPGEDASPWQETYYPGVLDTGKAIPLDVTDALDIEGLDFRLLAVQSFKLSGKVTFPSIDLSLETPTIVLIPKGVTTADDTTIRRPNNQSWEGFDVDGIPGGNYTLVATVFRWLRDGNSTRLVVAAGHVEVSVFSDTKDLVVPLTASGHEVTGAVVTGDNTPWSSGRRNLRVSLHAVERDTTRLPFLMEAADVLWTNTLGGVFRFTNVPPGRYSVRVSSLPEDEVAEDVGVVDIGEKFPEPLRIVIRRKAQD